LISSTRSLIEGKPGDMKELAEVFERAKAGAVPAG
jgi:hypothetical protein